MSAERRSLPEVPGVIARPAATVVLLRDGTAGCEALLVRRNVELAFHGGAWVFPGGRIDPADFAGGDPEDTLAAAYRAACREAWEEAGVRVATDSLVPFARWVTPEGLPKRFDAWFFAARAGSDTVRVDGGEIHEHRWIRPQDALLAHREGRFELPPPTWVTLHRLASFRGVAEALAAVSPGAIEEFVPRIHIVPDGACSVYAGDVAYDSGDLDQRGPRHRLWMVTAGWRYERSTS